MSGAPNCLVKSRENLQAIFNSKSSGIIKYQVFDRILAHTWNGIKQLYFSNKFEAVKYHINLGSPEVVVNTFIFTDTIITELIEVLKKEYPGVDFMYKESSGYDGKILERLIIMDWS
jgi:hypothetical protein